MSMRLSQEPSSISFKPGHSCTQVWAGEQKWRHSPPFRGRATGEWVIRPTSLPFTVQENTSGKSDFNNHSDIYRDKKKGGDSNKKRPLIKWNCHSGIRPSCLSACSQNKHLTSRPRWCHFLRGKARWVIPRHLDSYIMFKLFHGWMAAARERKY